MSRDDPSPREDDPSYAQWLPRDIPYNAAFEDSVQRILSHPPSTHTGIRVLPDDSQEQPQPGKSARLSEIKPTDLPVIRFEDLPIPLDDPRRKFASPVPGIRLTHPGGYLEGGPGFCPEDDVFAQDFISAYKIRDAARLRAEVERQIAEHRELAERRMEAREGAAGQNARVEKELKTLMDQRAMEVKIETRMKEEARAKRERREKKRATKGDML